MKLEDKYISNLLEKTGFSKKDSKIITELYKRNERLDYLYDYVQTKLRISYNLDSVPLADR